jgi:stage V sporulation protein G
MEITEIKVFAVTEEKLKAFVSVVFDQCFMVNDIKVIQGKDGLFISMPSRRKKNGDYKDVAHPLNNETRRWLEDRVLGEYRKVLSARTAGDEEAAGDGAAVARAAAEASGSPQSPSISLAQAPRRLEDVEEAHLSDSFWSVP